MLGACSPSSHQDFVQEADAVCRDLIQDLKTIHHSQDLFLAEGKLQKNFESLATLIVEARKHQIENPEEFTREILECSSAENLRLELIRVYLIEGGRESIEKAQREALARLSRFESKKSSK